MEQGRFLRSFNKIRKIFSMWSWQRRKKHAKKRGAQRIAGKSVQGSGEEGFYPQIFWRRFSQMVADFFGGGGAGKSAATIILKTGMEPQRTEITEVLMKRNLCGGFPDSRESLLR
jgi:hypothetical protein